MNKTTECTSCDENIDENKAYICENCEDYHHPECSGDGGGESCSQGSGEDTSYSVCNKCVLQSLNKQEQKMEEKVDYNSFSKSTLVKLVEILKETIEEFKKSNSIFKKGNALSDKLNQLKISQALQDRDKEIVEMIENIFYPINDKEENFELNQIFLKLRNNIIKAINQENKEDNLFQRIEDYSKKHHE
ncbi:MAG: hypothetical protein ACTSQE_12625 [Candidatus Heimdallarchaeaceae archaeon]